METEDFVRLPASSSSGSEGENDGVHDSCSGPAGRDSLPSSSVLEEDCKNGGTVKTANVDNEDNQHHLASDDIENDGVHDSCCEPAGGDSLPSDSIVGEDWQNGGAVETAKVGNEDNQLACVSDEDMDISPPTSQSFIEATESVAIKEEVACTENGLSTAEEGNGLSNHKKDVPVNSSREINATALSGAKRPRTTDDKQQPSVHVIYSSLTRESKRKLEELLQQWSQWHDQHCTSSNDSHEVLESGEKTYFPALHIGIDKASAVTFWMDNQSQNAPSKEFIALDSNSIPLYDRGFSLALRSADGSSTLQRGFDVLDDSRCFNCGSYSHALKDCPKPRDSAAVSNAMKQHKSKRNQNPSSRNPTRYYQNTPRGKYDGLKPGVLDAETKRLLGIGELDPPPWLNRMREIGYPPGYLDSEDEDQPSGITIFADEESKEETEEGEIFEAGCPVDGDDNSTAPKKMSVEFPGINAPIPENADRRSWEAGSSNSGLSRNQSYRRYDRSSESNSRAHYYEQMQSRYYRDDGPPGTDFRSSPSLSGFIHRYGGYNSDYDNLSPSGRRSPSYGRSLSERDQRSTYYDYSQ